MKTIHIAACLAGAAAVPSFGFAELNFVVEHDIQPHVVSSQIEIDGVPHGGGAAVQEVRIFGYEFGEDPKDPYFLADPGFDAEPGSGLPGGSLLGFDVVRHLAYWNGAGAVRFTTPPSGESLRFNLGADDLTVTGSSAAPSGFTIGTVAGDGSLHRHLNSFLQGPDTQTDPAEGVYFTNVRLRSSSGAVARSDSLYLVFNNGLSQPVFDAAMQYLSAALPGDANFDGVVNLADFNILAANFGADDRFWYEGDFNRDGRVNLADFNLLAANFGQSNATAPSAAVPEPAAATVVSMLVPLLATRRRQRRRSLK